jgi:two-component system chemotaxis response regulator CheY
MKVLLVDDSRTIRNIQKKTFAQLGDSEITEAANGVEALQQLSQARPDLVLIDWNMPTMDGITLVRKIRETDKTLPLIMCTTEAEKSRVIEAIQAGVNNYLIKPFTPETLKEKVEATMAKLRATVS